MEWVVLSVQQGERDVHTWTLFLEFYSTWLQGILVLGLFLEMHSSIRSCRTCSSALHSGTRLRKRPTTCSACGLGMIGKVTGNRRTFLELNKSFRSIKVYIYRLSLIHALNCCKANFGIFLLYLFCM